MRSRSSSIHHHLTLGAFLEAGASTVLRPLTRRMARSDLEGNDSPHPRVSFVRLPVKVVGSVVLRLHGLIEKS